MKTDKEYLLRMDKKLFAQLERYSKKNDLSVAQTARKAIKQFILEEKSKLAKSFKELKELNK